MIDAHLHLQDALPTQDGAAATRTESARLWRMALQQGLEGGICCATGPGDWDRVSTLAQTCEGLTPAFGLHPWQATTAPEGWIDQLDARLRTHPHALLGEIGLDGSPRHRPHLEAQVRVFEAQLTLAAHLNRPVVVHAVRAWDRMREVLDRHYAQLRGVMLHDYGGSADMLREWCALNVWFSVGPSILQPGRRHAPAAARCIPRNRLLVETDWPHPRPRRDPQPDSPAQALYTTLKALAALRGESPATLAAQSTTNAKRFLAGQSPLPEGFE